MDEIQKKVCTITDILPNCLSNRRILQSGLSDILADDRLHINLLLSAYDENIVDRLMSGNDAVIVSTNMIRRLKTGYGFSDELCAWSVITWLFILKRDDDAIAVFNMQAFRENNNNAPNSQHKNTKQEYTSLFCTNCGNRFNGTENYCSKCGKKRFTSNGKNNSVKKDITENLEEYWCNTCFSKLKTQQGFNPSLHFWACKECGAFLFDESVYSGERFKDIFWFCDQCRALLNTQDGFRDLYDYWKCTECSYINHIAESEIEKSSNSETPMPPSLFEITTNNFSSEKELVLATIDYYKETGRFPDKEFIRLHRKMLYEVSRLNSPQRYGAYLILGECYMHGTFGNKFISDKNIMNSIICFEEAIKCTIPIPEAEIELMTIYYCIKEDYEKSRSYCKSAIAHGDPIGSIYLVHEFLLLDAIADNNVDQLYEAMSVCEQGATMKSVPQYRSRDSFFINCYICAVIGQIISIVLNSKRHNKIFNKLVAEIKTKIQSEFHYNVIEDNWFEENVISLLTEYFELTPKQLEMIDLTNEQRKKIKTYKSLPV